MVIKINNKAQGGMSWQLLAMILVIIVLAIMAYLWATGGGAVISNLFSFTGGQANVQSHVSSCGISCQSASTTDYCRTLRTVIFDDSRQKYRVTCSVLETKSDGITRSFIRTPTLTQGILVPLAGLPYCDTIDRNQCSSLEAEAMISKDATTTNSRLEIPEDTKKGEDTSKKEEDTSKDSAK